MAIGPEQLDIRKLAKLFLLRGDLANALDKEILKEVLASFDVSDWDGIRENIGAGDTSSKLKLRAAINYCKQRLQEMDANVGVVNGKYPRYAVDVLEKAIAIALNISSDPYIYSNYSGGHLETYMEATAQTLNELTQKVFLMDNERLTFDSVIEAGDGGSKGICLSYQPITSDEYEWQPAKMLKAITTTGERLDVIVSPKALPAGIDPKYIHIDGLYLKDAETNRRLIITRQQYIPDTDHLISLLDFGGVEIVPGALVNDMLIIESLSIVDGHENAELAGVASSYLGRPINPVPVSFGIGDDNNVIRFDPCFKGLLKYAVGIEGKEAANVEDFETLSGDLYKDVLAKLNLNFANGNPFKEVDVNHVDKDGNREALVVGPGRKVISARSNRGRHILVDNRNKVITGITLEDEDISEIFFINETAVLYEASYTEAALESNLSGLKFISIIDEDGVKGGEDQTYIVDPRPLLIDQHEDLDEINNKVYGLHPTVYHNYNWIPSVLVRNVFISLEPPVNGEYKLYSENNSIIHVAGFVIGDKLFTRYDRKELEKLGIVKYDIDANVPPVAADATDEIKQKYELRVKAYELENLTRPYHYNEMAYYKGHVFVPGLNKGIEDGDTELLENLDAVKEFLGDIDLIKNKIKEANAQIIDVNKQLQEVTDNAKKAELLKDKERLQAIVDMDEVFIDSEFKQVLMRDEDGVIISTGGYYWYGDEANIPCLPNTAEENKLYLNIVAYKSRHKE